MGHHFVQSRQETCRGRIFRGVGACRRGFENRCFALARKSAVGRKRWMDHHEGQCWYSLCRGGDEALRCEKKRSGSKNASRARVQTAFAKWMWRRPSSCWKALETRRSNLKLERRCVACGMAK